MFKPHEREARIKIKRREINANKTTTENNEKNIYTAHQHRYHYV